MLEAKPEKKTVENNASNSSAADDSTSVTTPQEEKNSETLDMEFKVENEEADVVGEGSDTESEMMVMQQSDSMSSMGSAIVRIDSSTNLP